MSGFNQTGPSGRGPMTGRGRGLCNAGIPSGAGFGRGFRGGSGLERGGNMGRGLARNRAVFQDGYPQDPQVEMDKLKMQAESLKRTLDTMKQRLSEMEKSE